MNTPNSRNLHKMKQVRWSGSGGVTGSSKSMKSSTSNADESFLDTTKDLFDSQERLMNFLVENNIDFSEVNSNQFTATIKLINSDSVIKKRDSSNKSKASPPHYSKSSVPSFISSRNGNSLSPDDLNASKTPAPQIQQRSSQVSVKSDQKAKITSNVSPPKKQPQSKLKLQSPKRYPQKNLLNTNQPPSPLNIQQAYFNLSEFAHPQIDQHQRFTAFLTKRSQRAGKGTIDEIDQIYSTSTPQFQEKVLSYLNAIQQTIILIKNPPVKVTTSTASPQRKGKSKSIQFNQISPIKHASESQTRETNSEGISKLPFDCDLEILHTLLQKLIHPTNFDNQSMDEFVKTQLILLEQNAYLLEEEGKQIQSQVSQPIISSPPQSKIKSQSIEKGPISKLSGKKQSSNQNIEAQSQLQNATTKKFSSKQPQLMTTNKQSTLKQPFIGANLTTADSNTQYNQPQSQTEVDYYTELSSQEIQTIPGTNKLSLPQNQRGQKKSPSSNMIKPSQRNRSPQPFVQEWQSEQAITLSQLEQNTNPISKKNISHENSQQQSKQILLNASTSSKVSRTSPQIQEFQTQSQSPIPVLPKRSNHQQQAKQLRSNSKSISPSRAKVEQSPNQSESIKIADAPNFDSIFQEDSIQQYSSLESSVERPGTKKKVLHALSTEQLLWYYESIANSAKKLPNSMPRTVY